MWLPTVEEENRASIDSEILWPRDFKLYVVNDNMKLTTARAKVVGTVDSSMLCYFLLCETLKVLLNKYC